MTSLRERQRERETVKLLLSQHPLPRQRVSKVLASQNQSFSMPKQDIQRYRTEVLLCLTAFRNTEPKFFSANQEQLCIQLTLY